MRTVFCILVVSILLVTFCGCSPESGRESCEVACSANLHQIYKACVLYASEYGSIPYAHKGAKAHEHLQLLVDTEFVDSPKIFVCPASKADYPAEIDDDGKFKLSERTCSYAYSKVPLKFSSDTGKFVPSKRLLAADKQLKGQHETMINVVFCDGHIEGWGSENFYYGEEGSEYKDRKRYDTWEELTLNQLTGCPTYRSDPRLWPYVVCVVLLAILILCAIIWCLLRKKTHPNTEMSEI